MSRDDDLDWSIDEDAFEPDGGAPALEAPPTPPAPVNWRKPLTRRSTLVMLALVAGTMLLAAAATWWPGESQRRALEADVRAIDAAYQSRDEGIFEDLLTAATEWAPTEWVSYQAQLLYIGSPAVPMNWPRLDPTGQSQLLESRAVDASALRLMRIERTYQDPDDANSQDLRFVTLEAYTQTAEGRLIRVPLPELTEREVNRDRLDGAVRWTYSELDAETVDGVAPLVDAHFQRLCTAGLPCPDEGQLEVRISDLNAGYDDYWGVFMQRDTVTYMAGTLNAVHNTSGGASTLTLKRTSFAETGVPANEAAQTALARQITMELIARWTVHQITRNGASGGEPAWIALALRTAEAAEVLPRDDHDLPQLRLFTREELWGEFRSNVPALREMVSLLDQVLPTEPPDRLGELWAALPQATSFEGWLQAALVDTDVAARLAELAAPVELEVAVTGPLDGVLYCFESTVFEASWAGWRRSTGEAIPILDPSIIEAWGQTLAPMALSPDGTRLLLAAGRRIFVLDVAAGRAIRMPDSFGGSTWEVRWWGNDALVAPREAGGARQVMVRLNDDLTLTTLDFALNPFFLSHSGDQAVSPFEAGSSNSTLDVFDIASLDRLSLTYDRYAVTSREHATDRFWALSTLSDGGLMLSGVQLDSGVSPTPSLAFQLPSPDDDLTAQALTVDSTHAQMAVSYNTTIGFQRITILYRLDGSQAVETGRFEQATSGIPQLAFSRDGEVLFLTNGSQDGSTSGIDAYSTATAALLGTAPTGSAIVVDDGLTYDLLVGPQGLYLNLASYFFPITGDTYVATWNGVDEPVSASPQGCMLSQAHYIP